MLDIQTCISELGQEFHLAPQMISTCQERLLPMIRQHVSQQAEKQEHEHTQLIEKVSNLGNNPERMRGITSIFNRTMSK